MKTNILNKLTAIVLMLVLLFTVSAVNNVSLAQCQHQKQNPHPEYYPGNDFDFIQNLTPEQKEKIKNLRINHLKETLPIKNLINEKKAHLISVSSGDNPDMTAVNKTIDELYALKAELHKKRMIHRQEIRKLLNDEQKIIFDLHQPPFSDDDPVKHPKNKRNCCKGGSYDKCCMDNDKSGNMNTDQKSGCKSQGKPGCCQKK